MGRAAGAGLAGRLGEHAYAHPVAKLTLLVLAWAYFHHFLAGIRHLVMDLHIGMDLPAARRSGAFVLVLAVVLTFAVAVELW